MNSKNELARVALEDSGISPYMLMRKLVASSFGHEGDPLMFNGAAALRAHVPSDKVESLVRSLYPAEKAVMPTYQFAYDNTGSTHEQAGNIMTSVASGTMPADVAQTLIKALRDKEELLAIGMLSARIEELERKAGLIS